MRVLVTGARGQLGRELVPVLGASGDDAVGLGSECDITSTDAVRAALREHRPDVVVNCAAYTRVDDAESDADRAYRINAGGAATLAAACRDAGVRFCHMSTDYVFDGEKGAPYDESDVPRPVNVYGASKLAGEEEVRRLCPDHVIVRTAWLFGQRGPNFVLTMLRLAREGRDVRVVADRWGSPTWTGHLAPALVRVLTLDVRGVVHLCGSGETTWHGLAEAVMDAARLPVSVTPLRSEEYPTAARRPRRTSLECRVLRLLGEPAMPPWREGVVAYVREQLAG